MPDLRVHATSCEELTHWKRLCCWEGLGAGGEGDDRGWDGWMASLTQWTWVWVNSGSWWWTGRPSELRFMGSQSRTRLSDWSDLSKFVSRKGLLQNLCPDWSPPETSLQTISTNLPTCGVAGTLGSFECWLSLLSKTGYLEQECLLSSCSVCSTVLMLMDNEEMESILL